MWQIPAIMKIDETILNDSSENALVSQAYSLLSKSVPLNFVVLARAKISDLEFPLLPLQYSKARPCSPLRALFSLTCIYKDFHS